MKDEDLYDEMFKIYNTTFDTVKKVMDMFFQGDFRYLNLGKEIMVAGFLDNKAIDIEQESIMIEEPKNLKLRLRGRRKTSKKLE